MIIALCLSYLAMFTSGVSVTRTLCNNAYYNDWDSVEETANLLNGNETIDYYSNGDILGTYNTATPFPYNNTNPDDFRYDDYYYVNFQQLDLTLLEGVNYDISITRDYSSSLTSNEGLHLGRFVTYYSQESTNTSTDIFFSFEEDRTHVACNLALDVDIIYPYTTERIVYHTIHVPFFTNPYSRPNNQYYFGLTDLDIHNNTDYILVIFKLRLTDESVATTEYWQDGYSQGYDDGYGEGYNTGYEIGHQGDTNTFRGLLGALIDTPILFLRKFFGYEVFGVNIYAALATMISLIVALSIFRLVRSIV